MDASDQKNISIGQMSGFAEAATKLLAGVGLLALSTAFLYDFAFWACIDRRVLTFLVVSDHIQTAVYAFAVIMFAVGGVVLCARLWWFLLPKIMPFFTRGKPHRERYVQTAFEAIAAVVGSVALAYQGNIAVQILGFVIWVSVFFPRLFMPDVSLWRRVAAGLIVWLVMTALVAYADASAAQRARAETDIVNVEIGKSPMWNYEVRGHLLRLIERGAVIRSKDGRIIFVPKEHVLRIDQGVPAEAMPQSH